MKNYSYYDNSLLLFLLPEFLSNIIILIVIFKKILYTCGNYAFIISKWNPNWGIKLIYL